MLPLSHLSGYLATKELLNLGREAEEDRISHAKAVGGRRVVTWVVEIGEMFGLQVPAPTKLKINHVLMPTYLPTYLGCC